MPCLREVNRGVDVDRGVLGLANAGGHPTLDPVPPVVAQVDVDGVRVTSGPAGAGPGTCCASDGSGTLQLCL